MEATGGLLRLAPNWVPRSFLQPGLRLKLHPDDTYAYGLERGGIDERWFGSTTEAANDGREPDEGLSYVVHEGTRFLLRDVVAELGAEVVGDSIWSAYARWPVYSKFFDNMGPIPHHMHQSDEQGRSRRQARGLLLPPPAQQRRQQLPVHLHGIRAGDHP